MEAYMKAITHSFSNAPTKPNLPFTFEMLGKNNWQDTETIIEATELAAAAKVREVHPNVISIRRLYD